MFSTVLEITGFVGLMVVAFFGAGLWAALAVFFAVVMFVGYAVGAPE